MIKVWGEKGRIDLYNKYNLLYIIPNETEYNIPISANTRKFIIGKYYEIYIEEKINKNKEMLIVGIDEANKIANKYNFVLPPTTSIYAEENNLIDDNSNINNRAHNKDLINISSINRQIILILNVLKKTRIYENNYHKIAIDNMLKQIYSNLNITYFYMLKSINTILANENTKLNSIIQNINNYQHIPINYELIIIALQNKYKNIIQNFN